MTRLLQKAKAGDDEAFTLLVKAYQNKVYSLAYYVTKNHHDAEDVAQEVFIKLWRALPTYHGDAPDAWIMKIAKNTCLDFVKQKKRVEPLEYEINGESVERPIPDTDAQSNPPEAVMQKERRQEVQNALLKLSDEHREILTLRYMNGLSYEQLQEVLGVGMGTVKSRLARAKKSLQNILKSGNIF
jgi:RNA polymerase sigma-70 factor (ECF subfamily)